MSCIDNWLLCFLFNPSVSAWCMILLKFKKQKSEESSINLVVKMAARSKPIRELFPQDLDIENKEKGTELLADRFISQILKVAGEACGKGLQLFKAYEKKKSQGFFGE